MQLIKEIFNYTIYDDGYCFYYMLYPKFDDTTAEQWFFRSPDNISKTHRKIIYEDGSEFILPISEIIEVLPDRTGFIVIYDKVPSQFSKETAYPWFFERPNNAAIYNADGSLRCQLKNPWKSGFIFSFAQPSIKYPDLPSVILDSDDNPHDSSFYDLYAVDINTGELIDTNQQIRR